MIRSPSRSPLLPWAYTVLSRVSEADTARELTSDLSLARLGLVVVL
jgi:hypothetical protein